MANLTGQEQVRAFGVQANGKPSGEDFNQSTGLIAGSMSRACTAQVDKTSSTTLATITGLSAPLVAGATYIFRALVTGTSTANGGAKFAIGTSDTLTATSFSCTGTNSNGTTANAATVTTTLGTAVGAATAVFTRAVLEGAIVVNAAGTLTVQFAQNASHADTSSAYINSTLSLVRVS